MNFRSAFNRGESEAAPLGSETVPVYSYRINKKTGKRMLEKTGETNIYEKIQASLESTKLENIIKRAMEDPTALNVKEGNYIDLTNVPTNLMDIQNMILKANDQFADLPAEIRKKFDNSTEMFVSQYGTEEWLEKMGYKNENQSELSKEIENNIKTEEQEETK